MSPNPKSLTPDLKSEAADLPSHLIKERTGGEPIEAKPLCEASVSLDLPPHPWSAQYVHSTVRPLVGVVSEAALHRRRREAWACLRAATSPEERLSWQRMIDQLGRAIGWADHGLGRKICADNLERAERDRAEEAERAAVDAWRLPANAMLSVPARPVRVSDQEEQ